MSFINTNAFPVLINIFLTSIKFYKGQGLNFYKIILRISTISCIILALIKKKIKPIIMRWLLFFKNVKVNIVYGKFSEFFSKKYIYKKINYILSIAGIPAINDIPY